TVIALGDRYLLRIFGDLADIGRYAVGYKIAASLGVATRAFQVAWPTMLFSMAKTPDGEKFYAKLLTYFLVVLGLCGVVVSAFARDIIQLFTSSAFTGGYVVVPVLVLAQLGLGAFYVTAVGTNLAGKTHLQTVSALVAAAVFGVAGVALVPA